MSVAAPQTILETPARQFHSESGRTGREVPPALADHERHLAVAAHLSPLAIFLSIWFAFLAPLVIWLIWRRDSVFFDDHGREIVNFGISFVLWHILLAITIIGILLIPVLWVIAIINLIRGAIAASDGRYFRYPVTIRFLK